MTKKTATMNVVNDEPQKNEELIERIPLDETPFVIIKYGEKYFGTFGQYKITEDYTRLDELKKELSAITWNRLTQIMTLIVELLKQK